MRRFAQLAVEGIISDDTKLLAETFSSPQRSPQRFSLATLRRNKPQGGRSRKEE
jgi:hypothetical protein